MGKKIDVIVPVFNEEMVLKQFYRKIRAIPLEINLTFIDNASTDKSLSILKGFNDATVIKHDRNEGYGASICDGQGTSWFYVKPTTPFQIGILQNCSYT